MPYTPEDERSTPEPKTVGDLTFQIAALVDEYVAREGICFATFGEAQWALQANINELNRRFVGPYEEHKLRENGEAYVNIAKQFRDRDLDLESPKTEAMCARCGTFLGIVRYQLPTPKRLCENCA